MPEIKTSQKGIERLRRDMLLDSFAEHHVCEKLVQDYVLNLVPDSTRSCIDEHLSGCTLCSDRVAGYRELDSYLETVSRGADRK